MNNKRYWLLIGFFVVVLFGAVVSGVSISNSDGYILVNGSDALEVYVIDFNTSKPMYAPMGEIYIVNKSVVTSIVAANTWSRVDSGFWQVNSNNMDFVGLTNGTLIYNGTEDVFTHVAVTMSVRSAGASDTVRLAVFKNGVLLSNGQVQFKLFGANDIGSTAIHVAPILSKGDYLELYLLNENDADDLTVSYANMFAMGMRS